MSKKPIFVIVGLGFEIAGFFLFVGGFLYLALSGRLVNMFRDRAPKPILFVVLVTIFAVHHWLALLSEPLPSSAAEPPEHHQEVETVEPPRPAPRVPKRRPVKETATPASAPDARPVEAPASWDTVIVKEGTPEQVFVPQAVDPAPPPQSSRPGPDPYESKAKRGIKAIGRFLRFRKNEQ